MEFLTRPWIIKKKLTKDILKIIIKLINTQKSLGFN